VVLTYGSSRP